MNEIRLIDANALKEEMNKKALDLANGGMIFIDNINKVIDNAPTVDVPTADAVQYTLGYQDGFLEGKKIFERPQGE